MVDNFSGARFPFRLRNLLSLFHLAFYPYTRSIITQPPFKRRTSRSVSASLQLLGLALVAILLLVATGRLIVRHMCSTTLLCPIWLLLATDTRAVYQSGERRVCLVLDESGPEVSAMPSYLHLLLNVAQSRNATPYVLLLGQPASGESLYWRLKPDMAHGIKWQSLAPTRHIYDASPRLRTSFRVYEQLSTIEPFYEVLLFGGGTPAYYSLLARGQGLALGNSTMIVILSQSQLLLCEQRMSCDSLQDLEVDHMQRIAVQYADGIVTSRSTMSYIVNSGWQRPKPFHVFPWAKFHAAGIELSSDLKMQTDLHSRPLRTKALVSKLANMTSRAPQPWKQSNRSDHGIIVSVCIAHHERGRLLFQTLESVRHQTIRHESLEVIIVDDGSSGNESLETLRELERWPEMISGAWRLLRRPARYLGAARNEATRFARGEFVYFLDDDNVLKAESLETLVRAVRTSGADVLTSLNEKWPSKAAPPVIAGASERFLPLGAASAVGVFKNCFGDASALIRTSVFRELGGFTEERGIGHEDWELWAKAVLRGYRLEVVPEALYWYRLGSGMLAESLGGGQVAQIQLYANHARNIRPYIEKLAGWAEAEELVRLAQGMFDAQVY